MSMGERLLELTEEYRLSREARSGAFSDIGTPVGREPSEIAADYESALRELLSS